MCSRSPHLDDAVEPLPQQERGVGSSGVSAIVVPGGIGSSTALARVRSRAESRPATMSTVCLQ